MLNAVVDLSHYNAVADFAQVRDTGIYAIIHKATQGTGYTDPSFAARRAAARAAGLQFGAYHFGTADDPIAQAEHLVAVAGTDPLLVLDYESDPQGQSMSLAEAEAFVERIQALTGRYPGLYSGNTVKEALAAAGIASPGQSVLSRCWFWLAEYGQAPEIPPIWITCTLWQYTDGSAGLTPHEVAGIGSCDRDLFNGTQAGLAAFWAANSG